MLQFRLGAALQPPCHIVSSGAGTAARTISRMPDSEVMVESKGRFVGCSFRLRPPVCPCQTARHTGRHAASLESLAIMFSELHPFSVRIAQARQMALGECLERLPTAMWPGQQCSTSGRLPATLAGSMHADRSRSQRQRSQPSRRHHLKLSLDRRRVLVLAEIDDRDGGEFPEMNDDSESPASDT